MSIRFKLLLIVTSMVLFFTTFISFSIYVNNKNTLYNNTLVSGLRAFSYIGTISSASKDILSTDSLSISFENWKQTVKEGKENIDSFLQSELIKEMIERDNNLDNTYKLVLQVWESAQQELDNITKEMNKNYTAENLSSERGILYKIAEVQSPELFELYASIFRTNKMFNLIFNESFNSLIFEVEKKISSSKTFLNVQIFIIIIIITIGLIITIFITNNIARNIKLVSNFVKKIANGDFTAKIYVKGKDEIFELSENVKKIVSFEDTLLKIKYSAESLDKSYLRIKEAVDNVYSSIKNQASSVKQATSSFQLLSNSINEIANNALKTNVIAIDTKTSINTSTSQIRNTISDIRQLSESAGKIMSILKILDLITEQTDLLSLNASIEAARAGEAGKGFVVVATEIRKLAETSSEATKEISKIAKGIMKNIKLTTEKSETSAKALLSMEESIEGVVTLIEQIANATEQESRGSKDIMKAVDRINDVTKINTKNADEIIHNNIFLKREVERLRKLVDKFKLSDTAEEGA